MAMVAWPPKIWARPTGVDPWPARPFGLLPGGLGRGNPIDLGVARWAIARLTGGHGQAARPRLDQPVTGTAAMARSLGLAGVSRSPNWR
ncbi:hypothetical protein NL676_031892 [Syzygium grande]|nr:hypothetical protein NL676_031892 [Syzygium grande]